MPIDHGDAPATRWTVLGAPLDSSGAARGEQRAPAALRDAGLVAALGADDAGDAAAVLADSTRDAATGIVGVKGLIAATEAIRDAVTPILAGGSRPVVIGGDCTVLLGALAAVRQVHDRVGLWFIDGHADYYTGYESPTGEAADMDLAIITGRGPDELTRLAPPPIVAPYDVTLLGHRLPDSDPDTAEELGLLPPDLLRLDATSILRVGPGAVGRTMEQLLTRRVGHAWLHLDLDVLDAAHMPAVTYPSSGGLDWESLTELMRPLALSPALLGVSIADLNPDLDPGGRYAARTVDLVRTALGGEPGRHGDHAGI